MVTDLELLSAHRRVWDAKPLLRESYRRYYDMLLEACPKDARVVELGCGIGGFGDRARERDYSRWIATDIIASPSATLRCDATILPFRSSSIDRIAFVDVLHHLAAPLAFFKEAARVLKPGGAVICVEPWVTPLSWPIYRFLHQEGCDLSRDVEAPFSGASKPAFEGDAGLTTLVCRKLDAIRWAGLGFEGPLVRAFNDFAYLATKGLREGRDAPRPVYSVLRAVMDGFFSPCSRLMGLRAFIRWRRLDPAARAS
jgi:SAM-dependent methyltransferase